MSIVVVEVHKGIVFVDALPAKVSLVVNDCDEHTITTYIKINGEISIQSITEKKGD